MLPESGGRRTSRLNVGMGGGGESDRKKKKNANSCETFGRIAALRSHRPIVAVCESRGGRRRRHARRVIITQPFRSGRVTTHAVENEKEKSDNISLHYIVVLLLFSIDRQ